mgnify:FL=1
MIKNIEKEYEEDDEDMLDEFVDRLLYEGKKLGLREGKIQAIIEVAINMLKEKCDKQIIKKCTGLSETKIQQLEISLQKS